MTEFDVAMQELDAASETMLFLLNAGWAFVAVGLAALSILVARYVKLSTRDREIARRWAELERRKAGDA